MGFLDKLFGGSRNTKQEEVKVEKLKIGIILGSTREGRVSPQVGEWVKKLLTHAVMLHMKLLI